MERRSSSGWSVAGVSNATKDHTCRKCGVSLEIQAGPMQQVDSISSEWLVYPNETWTYLGTHNPTCQIVFTVVWTRSNNFDSQQQWMMAHVSSHLLTAME